MIIKRPVRFVRTLTLLLAFALLPSLAEAHFVWLVRHVEDGQPRLDLSFGETAEPGESVLLDTVAGARVFQVVGGRRSELDLERQKHSFTAKLDVGSQESFFVFQQDLGVMTRRDEAFLLRYYAKTGPSLGNPAWKQGAIESLTLDLIPEADGDRLVVTVLWKGEPVEGAQIKAMGPGLGEVESLSDEKGRVRLPLGDAGLYSIRARHIEDQGGVAEGDELATTRHYTTLTVDVPKGRGIRTTTGATLPDLPQPVTSFGAAITGDWIYVYGGHEGRPHHYDDRSQGSTLRRLSLKDPSAGWQDVAEGPGLQGLALLAQEGQLYRIGGFTAKNEADEEHDLWSQAEVVRFDPEAGEWEELPSLPQPRSSFDAAVLENRIYVVGGWQLRGAGEEPVWHDTAYVMDLSEQSPEWNTLPEPPFQRRALSVAAFDGKIYAIGGMTPSNEPSTRVDVLDLETSEWSQAPSLIGEGMTGFGSSAFATGGRLYVSTYDGNVQRLAEDGQSWELAIEKLERSRFFHRMLPLSDEKLVMIGGADMMVGKFAEVDVVSVSSR